MQNCSEKFKIDIKTRSYSYALWVIEFIRTLPKTDYVCRIISNQLLRSATSVGANIIEAQSGSTRRDFTNFLNHSLKSANESKFWLGLLKDSRIVNNQDVVQLFNETIEIANILAKSLLTIRGRRKTF